MAYIGNVPSHGEFKKADSIASSFNGSLTAFDLDVNAVNQTVGDASQLIISLNGIVQEPGTAYTLGIGGGSVVFASAPASTDTCHIVILGGVGDSGTPADGSITAVKLAPDLRDLLEEEFTGNGSATTFTMARAVSFAKMLLITIDGVVQPTSAYSVSGTTLTISPALPNTTNVRVLHIGIPGAFNSAGTVTASMISSTGGTANQVLAVNSGGSGIEFQTVSGGGSALTVQEEGSSLSTAATTLNFVGAAVTASGTGATKTITIASGGLSDVVSDTTPQLGGTLDANSNTIDMGTNILTDANLGQFITAHGWGNHASGGYQTTSGLNAAIDTHVNQSNPTSGHVLSWNGSDYAWVANTGGGGGIASVVADTTPQLGGNLDTNSKNIVFGDTSGTAVNRLKFGAGSDLEIYHNATNSIIQTTNTHSFKLMGGSNNYIVATPANAVTLYHNGSPKIATSSTGIAVTGVVAATTLTGDGSGLTSLPAQAFSAITSKPTTLSGYGITDAATTFASLTSKPTTISGYGITDAATEFGLPADQSFTVVNSGSGSYTIGGGASGSNAALTLIRGRTYKFAVNASGHPFYINTSNTTGTGAAYVNGTAVINNGAAVGDIYFTVPDTAPATLYYNCQYHSSMAGTINISDAMVVDKTNGNLGIGTVSPTTKLSVAGATSGDYLAKIESTNQFGLKIKTTSTSDSHEQFAIHDGNNNVQFKVMGGGTVHATGINIGGSGAANRLDDYEEGSHDCTVTMGSGTCSLNSGYNKIKYTKVGRNVTVQGQIQVSAVSNPSGTMRVSLPFTMDTTSDEGANVGGGVVRAYNSDVPTGGLYLWGVTVFNTSNFVTLEWVKHNSATVNHVPKAGEYLILSFTYTTA